MLYTHKTMLIISLYFSLFLCLKFAIYGEETARKPSIIQWKVEKIDCLSDNESKADFFFTAIKDIAVDSRGNHYILDKTGILKFDPHGFFVCPVSGKGQGPGEYRSPQALSVDAHDNLYITDYRQIISFDKNLTHRLTIKSDSSFLGKVAIDQTGNLYGLIREYNGQDITISLVRMDIQGKIVESLVNYKDAMTQVKSSGTGGVMGGVKHYYAPHILFCPVGSDYFCAADNLAYYLHMFTMGENSWTLKNITQDVQPVPISPEEKKQFTQEYKGRSQDLVFPDHRPILEHITSDEKGRIYVILKKPVNKRREPFQIDVFNDRGQYLYQAEFRFFPILIRNGNVYSVVYDKDFNLLIKKMRVTQCL